MAIQRTDQVVISRAGTLYRGTVDDIPVLAVPVTRATLDAAVLGSGLDPDTVYQITDEGGRLAVATAVNAYTAVAKQSEAGGGGGLTIGQALALSGNIFSN